MDMEFLEKLERHCRIAKAEADKGYVGEVPMEHGWVLKFYRENNGYSVAATSPTGEMYMGEEINWYTFQEAMEYGVKLYEHWTAKY